MNECKHLNKIGDNYGESCSDCGAQLSGFGYGGWFGRYLTGKEKCIHLFTPVGEGGAEICIYCIERGAAVNIVALAEGDRSALDALRGVWGARFSIRFVPLPKSFGARLALAPGALFNARTRDTLDSSRFGDDAFSLRLLIAASRWPVETPQRRVWLAHYGRWGRFACALRDLGFIAGPSATVFHGKDMSAFLKKRPDAYSTLFSRGDLFLPISEYWRAKLLALGAPADRTFVHRMGVDTARFQAAPRGLAAGDPVRFIGVGRMVEKKGFDDALAAFAPCAPNRAPQTPRSR